MNCDEFASSLPEQLHQLDAEQERHASLCPDCSVMLRQRRRLTEGLQALALEWSTVEAPPRVEAQLVAAFRKQAGLPPSRHSHQWMSAVAWASAAAAVLAMALVLARSDDPPPEQPSPYSKQSLVQRAAVQSPGWADPETAAEEGFIPLPNAEQIDSDDAVNMVRVELPRSAMIALGYPVSADQASEKVEADVVLGSDGLPRAVRFVDE